MPKPLKTPKPSRPVPNKPPKRIPGRATKPTYGPTPLKKVIRGAMENMERSVTQPARNVANSVGESVRRLKRSVGR